MSKVLIFSDIHIACHKKSTERLDDCLKVLEWVFQTAIDRDIENIIFLGDLFHDRTKIDILTLHKTHEVFGKYLSKPTSPHIWLLLGNHDMWSRDKWDIYSPIIMSGWQNVHIIDHPQTLKFHKQDIDFLPFTENPILDLANLRNQGCGRILFSHLAVDGAILNSFGTYSDVAVEHDGEMIKIDSHFLNHWEKTLLGHYHAPQELYIGSPLQLSFGETGQQKHIAIFDLETLKSEYIVNNFSRKHIITTLDKLDKQSLDNNFVIIKVEDLGNAETVDLRKEIHRNYSVASLEIRPIIQEETSENDSKIMEDVKHILESDDKMMERYVKEKGHGDLDSDLLFEFGKKIKEALCRN